MYGWIITRDHLHEESPASFDSEVGVTGPSSIDPHTEALLREGHGFPFRLLDDDGIPYYSGRQIGGDGSEPLIDFGAPNAGCTMLQQREGDEWVTVIA